MTSYFDRILAEQKQGPELRKVLMSKIGRYFDGKIPVAFYTAHEKQGSAIDAADAGMLETLLLGMPEVKNKGLLLIIDSPGGDPLSAERIIKICRDYSENNFEVLVPGRAKSAATMIALGAQQIALSPASELGPIDIQISWQQGGRLRPAYAIIGAYDKLLAMGMNLGPNQRIEPILQQLSVFDPTQVEELRRIDQLTESIAVKVLQSGMLNGVDEDEVKALIKIFTDTTSSKTHGRPIFCDDIRRHDKECKLKIRSMQVEDPIWKIISEYHGRLRHMLLTAGDLSKVLESPSSSYSR